MDVLVSAREKMCAQDGDTVGRTLPTLTSPMERACQHKRQERTDTRWKCIMIFPPRKKKSLFVLFGAQNIWFILPGIQAPTSPSAKMPCASAHLQLVSRGHDQ